MLQKLEDFWTYKDWEVLQENEKRPVFGPLRKVHDTSSDIQTSDEWLDRTTNKTDSVRFGDGSGEPETDDHKTSDSICEKTRDIPGWYNTQQWTANFERQMQMPRYTGYCVTNGEYLQHLDNHSESGTRTDIDHYPQDVYWSGESYYRSTEKINAHNQVTNIRQEIDEDIADLAAELLRADSVLEAADNMAARLDCPQWKDRINFSCTNHHSNMPSFIRFVNSSGY